MMGTTYRQCLLVQDTPSGTREQTSWIPARFARLGQALRLRQDSGLWEDGWVVRRIGRAEITEQEANRRSWLWTKNRAATDI